MYNLVFEYESVLFDHMHFIFMGLEPIGFEASCAEQTLAKLSSNAEFIINFFFLSSFYQQKKLFRWHICTSNAVQYIVHRFVVVENFRPKKNQELIKSYKMLILLHFCI